METKVKLNDFDPKVGLDRGAGKLKEIAWYLVKMMFFLTSLPYPSSFKCLILRLFGATVGEGVVIKPRVNIHFPWKLEIKNHVWIGEEVFLLNFEKLVIGSNVCVSQRAFLCGGNHDYRDPAMSYRNGSITLEDGSWVGASSFIGPSVIIGKDSIITAGSIVTKSISSGGIYRGNPAVIIGNRWKEEL